jgi:hypothetical protein
MLAVRRALNCVKKKVVKVAEIHVRVSRHQDTLYQRLGPVVVALVST